MSPTIVDQLGRMVCATGSASAARTEGLHVADGSILQRPIGLHFAVPTVSVFFSGLVRDILFVLFTSVLRKVIP